MPHFRSEGQRQSLRMKFVMATLCNGTGTDFGLQCTQLWLTIVHSQLLAVLVVTVAKRSFSPAFQFLETRIHPPQTSKAMLQRFRALFWQTALQEAQFQSRAAPGNASVFSSGLLFMVADDFR